LGVLAHSVTAYQTFANLKYNLFRLPVKNRHLHQIQLRFKMMKY